MYVKLGNNVINLDLIREIEEVKGVLFNDKDNYVDYLKSKENIERWKDLIINGNEMQKTYTVRYAFAIHYIGEKYPKWVDHPSEEELTEAREQLCVLLNGNKPLMKVIL